MLTACARTEPISRTAVEELEHELGPFALSTLRRFLVPGETSESCILRFLKARSFNVSAAAKMLTEDLEWRDAYGVSALASQSPTDVLGCDSALLQRYLPQWHQGFDKGGRPVIVKQYGKTRLLPLLEKTSVDALLRLHTYENEQIARLCGQQTAKLGREISTAVVIVDALGFDPSHLRMPKAFSWGKGMALIDQDHYPERLGLLFIINAPPALYYFWSVLCLVLDKNTQLKVRIFAGRDSWESALLEVVDAAQLPLEYGGSCTESRN